MSWFEVFLLSLVEGATEFIPVSSTGHLILTSALLHLQEQDFTKAFNVVIQFGAILAVVVCYPRRFTRWDLDFFKKLFVSFLPAAVIGLLFKKKIEALLGDVTVVAVSLIAGGIVFLFVDRWLARFRKPALAIETMSYLDCLKVGFAQCCAMVPGVSRSASTIIGGVLVGLDKTAATEYSFFLAVPTLTAAAALKFLDVLKHRDPQSLLFLGAGVVLSFIFSVVSLKLLIHLVARYGFTAFGWYRILVGALVLWVVYG